MEEKELLRVEQLCKYYPVKGRRSGREEADRQGGGRRQPDPSPGRDSGRRGGVRLRKIHIRPVYSDAPAAHQRPCLV